MRASVIRAVLISAGLAMSVRGDGAESAEELDIQYVLIGAGIGLFLVTAFLIIMVCIIRKRVRDSRTASVLRFEPPLPIRQSRGGGVQSSRAVPEVGLSDLRDDVNPVEVASG